MRLKLGLLLGMRVVMMAAGLYAGIWVAYQIPLPHVQAGRPGKCDMKTGTPCGKGSCVAYGRDGKPNGTYCRKECSNSCCKCEERCNGHHKDTQPQPDEEQ